MLTKVKAQLCKISITWLFACVWEAAVSRLLNAYGLMNLQAYSLILIPVISLPNLKLCLQLAIFN